MFGKKIFENFSKIDNEFSRNLHLRILNFIRKEHFQQVVENWMFLVTILKSESRGGIWKSSKKNQNVWLLEKLYFLFNALYIFLHIGIFYCAGRRNGKTKGTREMCKQLINNERRGFYPKSKNMSNWAEIRDINLIRIGSYLNLKNLCKLALSLTLACPHHFFPSILKSWALAMVSSEISNPTPLTVTFSFYVLKNCIKTVSSYFTMRSICDKR